MGDPFMQVTWGHYYHVGGGSYVHSFQYPPPASFFPLGLQPGFYGNQVPQANYGFYQPRWNLASPRPPEVGNNPLTPATAKEDCCSEQELASESYDSVPMDISPNGSPVKQPSQPLVKFRGTVQSLVPEKLPCRESTCKLTKSVLHNSSSQGATSSTVQTVQRVRTRWATPSPTASSTLSPMKCNACLRKMLVQASRTSSCVKAEPCTCVQTPQEPGNVQRKSPKTSAQGSVLQRRNEFIHHLQNATEKHVDITKESARPSIARSVASQRQHVRPHVVEAVASHSRCVEPCVLGSGDIQSQRVEPCVSRSCANHSSRVEPCVARSDGSWSRHVEPCVLQSGASQSQRVETITKPSFNQHVHKDYRAANTVVKPRKRVIVRRVNGVARLFSVSARSPVKPYTEYTLIGKETDKQLDSPISSTVEEAKREEISAKGFVMPMAVSEKSAKQKSEIKSRAKDLKQEKHSPFSHNTKTIKAHSESGRKSGAKDPKQVEHSPSNLSTKSVKARRVSAHVTHMLEKLKHQHGKSARRRRYKWRQKQRKTLGTSFPSGLEIPTDQSLASALCTQKSASTDSANRHKDVLGSKEPVKSGLHTSTKSALSHCVKVNKAVSRAPHSCSVSLDSPGVKDADSTILLCEGQPDANDDLCSEKLVTSNAVKVISGIYAPRKVFVTVMTCTDLEVDPALGGYKEHGDGPFELQSQLEELDGGWMWSFE